MSMRQKMPIVFVAVLALAIGAWYVISPKSTVPEPKVTSPAATTSPLREVQSDTSTTTVLKSTEVPQTERSHAGMKLYRNEEFGFEFWYPKDWEIHVPAFYSKVSLFNMELGPDGASSVTINITPKEWIEEALVKMKARGVVVENSTIDGRNAIRMEDKDDLGRPATVVLVLVDDKYWIDITGTKKQEDSYRAILDSFTLPK